MSTSSKSEAIHSQDSINRLVRIVDFSRDHFKTAPSIN